MTEAAAGPRSFWQRATPRQAARAAAELYGTAAVPQVMRLARDAQAAGDDDDYRFWTAVYARLLAIARSPADGPSG